MTTKSLFFVTGSYPFDSKIEQSFIAPELPYLVGKFDRVVLIPSSCRGNRYNIIDKVEVETGLGDALDELTRAKVRIVAEALTDKRVFGECSENIRKFNQFEAIKQLLVSTARSKVTAEWFVSYITKQKIDLENSVFYTYWCYDECVGITLLKSMGLPIKIVSRAHGYDLYEEQHPTAYIPYQRSALRGLDKLLCDSKMGTEYIKQRFPEYSSKCATSLLGTIDPGLMDAYVASSNFRIRSCSFIDSNKRLDLLLRGIASAATRRSELSFVWEHIGGEKASQRKMSSLADELLPANVIFSCLAYPGNTEGLMAHYREHPADVFINTSKSEGTPVSVMEVISCYLPVIATAVGGNREIVSDENGLLIPEDPTPSEIGAAILRFVDNKEWAAEKRLGSRRMWEEKYCAPKNYEMFAQGLISEITNGFRRK